MGECLCCSLVTAWLLPLVQHSSFSSVSIPATHVCDREACGQLGAWGLRAEEVSWCLGPRSCQRGPSPPVMAVQPAACPAVSRLAGPLRAGVPEGFLGARPTPWSTSLLAFFWSSFVAQFFCFILVLQLLEGTAILSPLEYFLWEQQYPFFYAVSHLSLSEVTLVCQCPLEDWNHLLELVVLCRYGQRSLLCCYALRFPGWQVPHRGDLASSLVSSEASSAKWGAPASVSRKPPVVLCHVSVCSSCSPA